MYHRRIFARNGCTVSSVLMVCLVVVFALAVITATSQESPPVSGEKVPSAKKKETIFLTLRYPVGRTYAYSFTDTTVVRRIYSDSSTLDYTRTITYYFTQEALESPHDGMTTVQVTIDSVEYSFSSGGATVHYKTGAKMALTLPDLLVAVIPVNRPYLMTYSSYWDVAKVEGEMLEWTRQYIEENAPKVPQFDTLQKFLWLRNMSLPVLAHYGDLQKGALPAGAVTADSVWIKPFVILADGIEFRDPVARTRILEQRPPVVVLQSQCDSLRPTLERLRLYNLSALASIHDGKATCTHIIEWNSAGFIETAQTDLQAIVTAQVRNDTFTQQIHSRYRWKLRGIYQY